MGHLAAGQPGVDVVDHPRFTRAAERLCLSQPAVSDQVRKLEERFGVSLLRRSRRSVELTDLGERLLQWLHGCNSRTPH
ncbi:MAG: LysR family transcriptional regulator, partial [Halomonas sp.]|nr:LysR family transcriptional regulator [Halomonas sp.]